MPHVHSASCSHGRGHGHAAAPRGFAPSRYPLRLPSPRVPPYAIARTEAADANGDACVVYDLAAAAAAEAGAGAGAGAEPPPSLASPPRHTGQSLLDAGVLQRAPRAVREAAAAGSAESRARFVEGVTVFDEAQRKCDKMRSRLDRAALAALCGPEAAAALEALPPAERRVTTALWLFTGGDVRARRAGRGLRPLLHTIDEVVADLKPKVAEMD